MQMHHLNVTHEAHSPTYKEWLDIKDPYANPTMEAKDVTMHVLEILSLWGSQVSTVVVNLGITIWSRMLWSIEANSNLSHVSKKCSIGSGSLGSLEFVATILTARRITSMKSWV